MKRKLFEEEHQQFRQSFRRWLEQEIVPNFLEWERDGIVPRDLFRAAGEVGFLGMAIPAEYGGGGRTTFASNQSSAQKFSMRASMAPVSASLCTMTFARPISSATPRTPSASGGCRESPLASSSPPSP